MAAADALCQNPERALDPPVCSNKGWPMPNPKTSLFEIEARRSGRRERSLAMGITPEYIAQLVDAFYGKIRDHGDLGPIFEEAVGGDWDPHLTKMKSFWRSMALHDGSYSGRVVPAHKKLAALELRHFDAWLSLFRETLDETAPSVEAADDLMRRAEMVAESLKLALFGAPGFPTNQLEIAQD